MLGQVQVANLQMMSANCRLIVRRQWPDSKPVAKYQKQSTNRKIIYWLVILQLADSKKTPKITHKIGRLLSNKPPIRISDSLRSLGEDDIMLS